MYRTLGLALWILWIDSRNYLDGTDQLLSTQSEKDLGFTRDEKFDFGEHIKGLIT